MRRIVITSAVLSVILLAAPVLADGLVPCEGPDCGTCELMQMATRVLEFLVQAAVFLAGVVFAWGGFKMVISGGESGSISEARGMMTNALVGIVIVLCAWLLIDTLLKLVVDDSVVGVWNEITCTPTEPATQSQSGTIGTLSDNEARSMLSAAGITVNKTEAQGTSLEGIRRETLEDAIRIKQGCNCDVVITGGTETTGGHVQSATGHTAGYKYDMRPNQALDLYIGSKFMPRGVRSDGAPEYVSPHGVIYAREADHWDVMVP